MTGQPPRRRHHVSAQHTASLRQNSQDGRQSKLILPPQHQHQQEQRLLLVLLLLVLLLLVLLQVLLLLHHRMRMRMRTMTRMTREAPEQGGLGTRVLAVRIPAGCPGRSGSVARTRAAADAPLPTGRFSAWVSCQPQGVRTYAYAYVRYV